MPELTGAEWIADALVGAGFSHVFVLPNNLFATLIELEKRGVGCVLAHSEKAAAYMADGYARAAGRPGIVITQGGPGATNVVAGLADAYQAHSPVVALTRSVDPDVRYRDAYQDVGSDFSLVTRFSADVLATSQIPRLVTRALREATAGAPRPTHLSILPAAERGLAMLPEPLLDAECVTIPSRRPLPNEREIVDAQALLLAAERPVMVAGGGVIASRAWDEAVDVAERFRLPVVTSLSGKGTIAETHVLAVGVAGVYGRSCANRILREADLVLMVGVHGGSQLTCRWTAPTPGVDAIQVDIEPSQLGRNYPLRVGLCGDAKATLARLADGAPRRSKAGDGEWPARVRGWADAWEAEHEPWLEAGGSPLRPERVCAEMSRSLPHDAVVVCDTGYAAGWIGCFWKISENGQRLIRCEGSLGWAFPASVGVACALPDRPVFCCTGDGGLWYHLAELETLARLGIPVKTVVLDNSALAFEAHILDTHFGGQGQGLAHYRQVDFAAVARELGVAAERVESETELRSAFRRAIESPGPFLLDVVVDGSAHPPLEGGMPLT